jgi:hypothetical protein
MAIPLQDQTMPPVPKDEFFVKTKIGFSISPSWLNWFEQFRLKVNQINSNLSALSQGFPSGIMVSTSSGYSSVTTDGYAKLASGVVSTLTPAQVLTDIAAQEKFITTSGTATAGASVLPSNPVGFIETSTGFGSVKIPYYSP